MPVLYKEQDTSVEFSTLSKLNDERGELLAVVYAPEVRDSQGDIASAEVIKQMAYDASKAGVEIDIRHDGKPVGKDRAFIAEKFIVAKGDQRFDGWRDYDGKAIDLTGAWAIVVKIEDADLKKRYRDGDWNGVSLFGPATVEIEKSEDDMAVTKEELAKMLDERDAKLAALIKDAAPKPPEKKPDETFDPLNKAHVEKKLAELERDKLAKTIDWTDPDAVRAYRDSLAGGNTVAETVEQKADRLEKEAKGLREKNAKLLKASNAAPAPAGPAPKADEALAGLSKEEAEAVTLGKQMAEIANRNRGFVTAK